MKQDHLNLICGAVAAGLCLSASPGGESFEIAMMQCSKSAQSCCGNNEDCEDFLHSDCSDECEAPSSEEASAEELLLKKSAQIALDNE